MARVRLNNISSFGTTNPVTFSTNVTTTGSFTTAPAFPTIAAPDYAVIVVEPDTANEEIVYLTAYTSGATSGTFVRGREGSTAVAHSATAWVHGPTAADVGAGGIYGDGSDGAQTFDGTTTILGIVPSGSTYILARDLFLSSMTINSGVSIATNGFRLFCQTPIINNGTIRDNGNAASGATGGAGQSNSTGSLSTNARGTSGGTGGSGAGPSGTTQSGPGVLFGGTGGSGGTSGANTGGAGGTLSSVTEPTSGSLRAMPMSAIARFLGGSWSTGVQGGAGGGAGGGDGTNAGGGGGAGGGVVVIIAPGFGGTGVIQARGGAGGAGVAGNASGGGGGGGGLVLITSSGIVAGAISGQTIDANGGALGAKAGTGSNGVAGSNGTVVLVPA